VMLGVIVVSLISFFVTLDTLPRTIVIATARPDGQYHQFGTEFQETLHRQIGRPVDVVESEGSLHNRDRLLAGEIDLTIVQPGSVSLNGIAVVAPLHRDVVYVIARQDRGIGSINDLEGRNVILGPARSGMRSGALHVLGHYGLQDRVQDQGSMAFDQIDEPGNEHIDAAIVVTGLDNRALREVLTGKNGQPSQFMLLPINARAIAAERSFFREFELPRGFFAENPAVPAEEIPTVSTTALLVVRDDAPARLVEVALDALYKEDFQAKFPYLISHEEVASLPPVRLHPVARRYFDPFDRVGWIASVMESLAATKELLFALGAGLFLLWDRRRRLKEKAREEHMRAQKDRLDKLMQRTIEIEREQMDLTDPQRLEELLDEVTKTKLQALDELTHEDLRADQSFAIFLMQCANVISKIQLKIMRYTGATP